MQLNADAIKKFQGLYLEEYGVKLTDYQAQEHGSRLVALVKTVYGSNLPKLRTKQNLTNIRQKVDN